MHFIEWMLTNTETTNHTLVKLLFMYKLETTDLHFSDVDLIDGFHKIKCLQCV